MGRDEPQFLEVGVGEKRRRIAYRFAGEGNSDLGLLWCSGYLSDMASTKAAALADWGKEAGLPTFRFDYSGHGLSQGDLLKASIGDWLEEAEAATILAGTRVGRVLVVGSSMGAWIALLLARKLAKQGALQKLAGLVLIAPAWDMTERLMWHRLTAEMKETIESEGVYWEPSLYGDPYPITKLLIEDGRRHLLGEELLDLDLPIRILQGMCDPDVPWGHSLDLLDLLCCDDVELTLIKDGDHRLSRPQDLRRLQAVVSALAAGIGEVTSTRNAAR